MGGVGGPCITSQNTYRTAAAFCVQLNKLQYQNQLHATQLQE